MDTTCYMLHVHVHVGLVCIACVVPPVAVTKHKFARILLIVPSHAFTRSNRMLTSTVAVGDDLYMYLHEYLQHTTAHVPRTCTLTESLFEAKWTFLGM